MSSNARPSSALSSLVINGRYASRVRSNSPETQKWQSVRQNMSSSCPAIPSMTWPPGHVALAMFSTAKVFPYCIVSALATSPQSPSITRTPPRRDVRDALFRLARSAQRLKLAAATARSFLRSSGVPRRVSVSRNTICRSRLMGSFCQTCRNCLPNRAASPGRGPGVERRSSSESGRSVLRQTRVSSSTRNSTVTCPGFSGCATYPTVQPFACPDLTSTCSPTHQEDSAACLTGVVQR
mmetsp:Transcript_85627/g.239159  ORF Transcript_85627/g.239159 Transcript_85627/m.239159 type:complete len:238 (-) Transcript_85627:60-773(-)